ncbi:MAG: site-specific DNA-methyltransferase, partial [Anaerolineae bacterium]|nr:site-specific DNA-methyltransferase [Anaerolineae bacterium]
MKNRLYYGDNLPILRDHIDDASVDLIYLDPPFNAARDFNVLFQDESGQFSDAQVRAFTDTWHWNEDAERVYEELLLKGDNLGRLVEGLRLVLNRGPMMAYLVMMAVRLVE